MGHRRWLPNVHPFRNDVDAFDGTIETTNAPPRLSGSQIMREQDKVNFKYGNLGKSSKTRASDKASTSVGGVSLGASGDDTNDVEEFEDDPEIVMEAQPTTNSEVFWKKKKASFLICHIGSTIVFAITQM